jgi:hypothetical protein
MALFIQQRNAVTNLFVDLAMDIHYNYNSNERND